VIVAKELAAIRQDTERRTSRRRDTDDAVLRQAAGRDEEQWRQALCWQESSRYHHSVCRLDNARLLFVDFRCEINLRAIDSNVKASLTGHLRDCMLKTQKGVNLTDLEAPVFALAVAALPGGNLSGLCELPDVIGFEAKVSG
jgi:hypothetical protein